ncbi:hypothetical protein EV368DRAFT_88183 [Lentinula lateritia]|nr:hypothetical protein EV368DRAFT_88183 [Lentinula lateritia]
MDVSRQTRHIYTTQTNSKYHDRVELLHTSPVQSKSIDRRILNPELQRVARRTSPNQSPSPDPTFYSSPSPYTSTLIEGRIAPPSSSPLVYPRTSVHRSPASQPNRTSQPRIILTRNGQVQKITPEKVSHVADINVAHSSNATQCLEAVTPGSEVVTPGSGDADEEELEDVDSALGKIPKPRGEVSRPGRGGYNLRVELKWSTDRFDKVKAYIDKLVQAHLDCTEPLTRQLASKVEETARETVRPAQGVCWGVVLHALVVQADCSLHIHMSIVAAPLLLTQAHGYRVHSPSPSHWIRDSPYDSRKRAPTRNHLSFMPRPSPARLPKIFCQRTLQTVSPADGPGWLYAYVDREEIGSDFLQFGSRIDVERNP